MDLGLLMSNPPERHTEFNLFLTRIDISVSYSLIIFSAGQWHYGRGSIPITSAIRFGVFDRGLSRLARAIPNYFPARRGGTDETS